MVWDPVKAFKCECLDGYEGELCEKNITLAKNGNLFQRYFSDIFQIFFYKHVTNIYVMQISDHACSKYLHM